MKVELVHEDFLGQKRVDTFFPVHELGNSQINRVAGQDVGLITGEALLLAEEIHHLDDRNPGCHLQIFVKSHRDKVGRRFGSRPEESLSFADRQLESALQGSLQRRDTDLAISLRGVPVSGGKERAFHVDREVNCRSGYQLFVVDVASMYPRGPLLIRPEKAGGATPMTPKKGLIGISMSLENLATLRLRSSGVSL